MSTPMPELPPMPEPEVIWVDGCDQYGYDTYDHAFSADQMHTYAIAAIEAATLTERERAAQVCERLPWIDGGQIPSNLAMAKAIRSGK